LTNPGEILVIKIGGSTLGSHDTTLRDVVSLHSRGLRPVVVHGGGNKVTEWLGRLGIETEFVRGRRVTDTETLQVVIAVLAGLVNKELVSSIIAHGGNAVGLSGADGGLMRAEIREPDLGYVGEITQVDPAPVNALLDAGYIPVIATSALGPSSADGNDTQLLNVNGDTSACEIAVALKASRLIFLTDVPGVKDGQGAVLSTLTRSQAQTLMDSGVISGGMIPKVAACLHALPSVPTTQIIDGRPTGALVEAADSVHTGTTIVGGRE